MMKLTITRKRWIRGKSKGRSLLLRPSDGRMCCLGFLALACGHTKEDISKVDTPASMAVPRLGKMMYNVLGEFGEFMDVNDDREIPEHIRESKLRKLFRAIGVEVKFV